MLGRIAIAQAINITLIVSLFTYFTLDRGNLIEQNQSVKSEGVHYLQSSLAGELGVSVNDNLPLYGYYVPAQGKPVPVTGNTSQLSSFLTALKNAKQKKMRIAHWGDSIILGDIITENIRESLQKQFGGNGAGFISINCDDYGMRNSTVMSFSSDWTEASLFKRNPNKLPLGINGAVYQPSNGSWAKYEIGKVSRTLKNFSTVRLFYANGTPGGTVQFQFNNGSPQTVKLESGSALKEIVVNSPNNTTSVKLTFYNCNSTYFYGVSLENGNGVYVDNLPIRGNSGVSLGDLPIGLLKEFQSLLNYQLLIIHFGVNVLSPEHKNYLWYETKMEKAISHLKSAFPGVSILLVSVSDKAVKKGSKFVTDPMLSSLLKSQQVIAEKNNIAFWNMFEAMGGENSVVEWVEARNPLAYKDYCHLTPDGGKVIGELLVESLLKAK